MDDKKIRIIELTICAIMLDCLLTISFVVLKLFGAINWNWVWVLSPIWLLIIIFNLIVIVSILVFDVKYRRKDR